MKYWLIAALLLVGCKKKGPTKTGASKDVEKPEMVLHGKAKQRLRDLELQCSVEVDPENNLVWVEMTVINHSNNASFLPSPTDKLWMRDRGGRVTYIVGSPQRLKLDPPKAPIYATMAPQEIRTWKVAGEKSPSPLAEDGAAQDFLCAVSQGPDGHQYLQAGGRAIDAMMLKRP